MSEKQYIEFINKNYSVDYTEKAKRLHDNAELVEAAMGLAGEAGEVLDLIKKHVMYGTPFPESKFLEEVGDTLHYLTRILYIAGYTPEHAREANTRKLRARFPTGYSDAAAIARADTK